MNGVVGASVRWPLVGAVGGCTASSSDAVVVVDAVGQSLINSLFSWFGRREEVGSMVSGCSSCDNVEEERVREESWSVNWFCIVVVVVGIGVCSRSERFSVGSASGDVVLLFVVLMSCVGVVVGAVGCFVVVVVVVDDCCCSFFSSSVIRRSLCMLRMIWRLSASKSTGVVVVVLTVVVKGRLHDVVLGSGVGVETRGGVIIVVGADRFALRRNRLIARCGKGNFSTSAATVR